MNSKKITIIGGGNLGQAVAKGVIGGGFAPENMHITRRNLKLLDSFKEQGVTISSDNCQAVKGADIVILAVKPYQAEEIIKEITPHLNSNQIFISLLTTLTLDGMSVDMGIPGKVYRVIPNTAASVGESITAISTECNCEDSTTYIKELFENLGKVVIVPENMIGAATVIGSCGTAFALRFIRALQIGGVEIGFKADESLLIAAQMVKGAAQMILESGGHPETEIDKVTTPKGITIKGLNEMEHQGLSSAVIQGVLASYNKIV